MFIAGNSLGGFVATNLAANHPRVVRGLALMNATPFWAFRKPAVRNATKAPSKPGESGKAAFAAGASTSAASDASPKRESATAVDERVSAGGGGDWLGWDGTLPAPEGLFRFGAWYFDRMRDPRTVKSMLGAVYSNAGARCSHVLWWLLYWPFDELWSWCSLLFVCFSYWSVGRRRFRLILSLVLVFGKFAALGSYTAVMVSNGFLEAMRVIRLIG